MGRSESGLSHRRLRRSKVMKPSANDNSSQLIEFSGRCIVEKRICSGCSFHRGATLTSFALMRLKRTRRYVVRHLTCPYNSMHGSEMAAPSSSRREIGNPITCLIIRQPVAVIAAREIFSASPLTRFTPRRARSCPDSRSIKWIRTIYPICRREKFFPGWKGSLTLANITFLNFVESIF